MNYLYNIDIEKNIENIRKDIVKSCNKVGRSEEEVKLIAVSKTVDSEKVINALNKVQDFGENRVQELTKKYDILNDRCNWHFIGQLQTNKVKHIIDKVSLIHSLDRISLVKELQKQAESKEIIIDVLIQVNVAKEKSKTGIFTEDVFNFARKVSKYPNIRVKGLMTIAPYEKEPETVRWIFRDLKKLFVDIAKENIDNIHMEILSMGMTNDFKIAIEEGSTMIRIGSAIFGECAY